MGVRVNKVSFAHPNIQTVTHTHTYIHAHAHRYNWFVFLVLPFPHKYTEWHVLAPLRSRQ